MKFAKVLFWIAGIWGVLLLAPLYFMFDLIGRQDPPPITHPAFYYGFAGAGLAFQFVFFVIATDPVRFRPVIIPSVIEKFAYGGALTVPTASTAPGGLGFWRDRSAAGGSVPGCFL
jgi:hypothetical protein